MNSVVGPKNIWVCVEKTEKKENREKAKEKTREKSSDF